MNNIYRMNRKQLKALAAMRRPPVDLTPAGDDLGAMRELIAEASDPGDPIVMKNPAPPKRSGAQKAADMLAAAGEGGTVQAPAPPPGDDIESLRRQERELKARLRAAEASAAGPQMAVERDGDTGDFFVAVVPGDCRRQIQGRGHRGYWETVAEVSERGARRVIVKAGRYTRVRLVRISVAPTEDGGRTETQTPLLAEMVTPGGKMHESKEIEL